MLERTAVHAITQMPYGAKAKVRGELRTMLCPEEKLLELFDGQLFHLWQCSNYGSLILYGDGVVGWFRQNGFYADFMIGCQDAKKKTAMLQITQDIVWNE